MEQREQSARVVCPNCGTKLLVKNTAGASGRTITCPRCQAPMVVSFAAAMPVSPSSRIPPQPPAAAMLQPAQASAASSAPDSVAPEPESPVPPKRSSRPKSGSSKGWLYAIIGILAVIIAGLVIYLLSVRDAGHSAEAKEEVYSSASVPVLDEQTSALAAEVDDTAASIDTEADNTTSDERTSNFDCHSEDLYSNEDHIMPQSYSYEGKSARINSSWLEHDVNEGIRIHVNMATNNLLNIQVEVVCFFWFDDGRQVKSTDGQYESPERQVCTQITVTPNYQECNWNDLQLFIPYRQIKNHHDWKHLKCRVEVFYNHHCIATGGYMHFACWLN